MGMNYYYHQSGERRCPHCGQETPNLHVGKSSIGWCFSLRVHPHEGIVSLDDWRERWAAGGAIFDESGDPVTPAEMESVIVNRSRPGGLRSHVGFASHGDISTARYGGPTWDLCDYEFS